MKSKDQTYHIYSWTIPYEQIVLILEKMEVLSEFVEPDDKRHSGYLVADLFSEQVVSLALGWDIMITNNGKNTQLLIDQAGKRFRQR